MTGQLCQCCQARVAVWNYNTPGGGWRRLCRYCAELLGLTRKDQS